MIGPIAEVAGKVAEVAVEASKETAKEVGKAAAKKEVDIRKRVEVGDSIIRNEKSGVDVTKRIKHDNSDSFDSSVTNKKVDSRDASFDTKEVENKEGGSYRDVKKYSDGENKEVHHVPSDSASYLERDDGPAIKMDKEDHRQTASCGNSKEAREYRAKQKELIDNGRFKDALQMDIDDIRSKFGNKYDKAIDEMLKYVDKLEQEGKING